MLYCSNKQNKHANKRIRDTPEKAQTSGFKHAVVGIFDWDMVLVSSSELRKTSLDAADADTLFSTMLECPEDQEEEEYFDEFALRHSSTWVVAPVENREFG